ncbi:MAG: aspartate/glutamate racemase family protein [Acidobacteriota bacterium]
MNRLGIIDWGIGGISVYKVLIEQLGELSVTYLSDTGATPYGKMSRRELADRLDNAIEFLKTRGVDHLLIGCNAASTSIPDLTDHSIAIQGVIEPAIEMVVRLRPNDLGLIGGRRTVVSGVYRRGLADRGIRVRQRIAQPLSALIESGDVSSSELKGITSKIVTPLRECSHILLACTHYPAIAPVIAANVSAETILVDPASELVDTVREWRIGKGHGAEFLTTGDSRAMRSSAEKAFGVKIGLPIEVMF